MERELPYFGSGHPLWALARQRCRDVHGVGRRSAVCDACWECVIRDDERVVVLFDLPRELEVEPDAVDGIAVERACRGELVPLTIAERRAAVARLAAVGLSRTAIARRLRLSGSAARDACSVVLGVDAWSAA